MQDEYYRISPQKRSMCFELQQKIIKNELGRNKSGCIYEYSYCNSLSDPFKTYYLCPANDRASSGAAGCGPRSLQQLAFARLGLESGVRTRDNRNLISQGRKRGGGAGGAWSSKETTSTCGVGQECEGRTTYYHWGSPKKNDASTVNHQQEPMNKRQTIRPLPLRLWVK